MSPAEFVEQYTALSASYPQFFRIDASEIEQWTEQVRRWQAIE